MIRGVTQKETRTLGDSPMNLDVGRLDVRETFQLGGLVVAALAVATLGAMLIWLVLPGRFDVWSGWRVLLAVFGGMVGLVGFLVGLVGLRFWVVDTHSYHRRLDDWHYARLAAFEGADGQEVQTEVRAWELTTNNGRDVLLAALAVHQAVQAGDDRAFTVRRLVGDKWLGGLRLGDVNTTQAQRLSRACAQLGLVEGGEERQAGRWKPENADQVIELVVNNWARVKV